MIRFRGQKVKGQGYNETKYGKNEFVNAISYKPV